QSAFVRGLGSRALSLLPEVSLQTATAFLLYTIPGGARAARPQPPTPGLGGSIRNVAMENMTDSALFPCQYAASGCEKTLPHGEKATHEVRCEFGPYSCPLPGVCCKWKGPVDAVVPHLMRHRTPITMVEGPNAVLHATDIDLPGTVDWVMIQSCFGFQFMIVMEKQVGLYGHEPIFALVQLIGTREQAENFACQLELSSPGRRLTWTSHPRSIREGVRTAILNHDCLGFDITVAQCFAENDTLSMNVTISRCSNGNET
ncbi:E3 ubiquitin-protein ligase SIAH1A-like, partial [Tenrec ecaudatus]|uniref:E3 ubiquitin-protein ligase SIAH1A-like n=1 Tax=Tenrec ecaudatus TaxID=94439 RepID=UPI003F593E16